MIECKNCLRCGSERTDKLMVNTTISLNYPERRNPYTQLTSQKIINPNYAIVCKNCGHVELLVDWNN